MTRGSLDLQALEMFAALPERLRKPRRSMWADVNLAGMEAGCFLEGPAFDAAGNLYVVDIPFGRVFRLNPQGDWHTVAEYDGWPNGLKVRADGQLLVADHRLGLLRIDPATGSVTVLLNEVEGAPLLGLNDLTLGPDGSIYVTDQGQTGLHDPRGRVLRVKAGGAAEVILGNGPSPNGLVFDRDKPWLYVAMTRGNAVWRVPLVEGKASKVGIAIQLSGGIGPDGLALDPDGCLLVAHPPIGVWRFDAKCRPVALYEPDESALGASYVTNLAVRADGHASRMFIADSIQGRILTAALPRRGAEAK